MIIDQTNEAMAAGDSAKAIDAEHGEFADKTLVELEGYGAGLPAASQFALKEFKNILTRQSAPPGSTFKVDEKGMFQVAPEGGEAEPAPGEEAPEEAPGEEVPDLARQEIEKLIDELDSPNPSREALRLKEALFRDPKFKEASAKYGSPDKALQYFIEDYKYRKQQGNIESKIARREEVLANPDAYSQKEVAKANLGKIFGRKRSRWRSGYERREAEAAAEAAAAPPVGEETPPAEEPVPEPTPEPVPAPPVEETTEEVDPEVQAALEEIARLKRHNIPVSPRMARKIAKRAKLKRREAFERKHRGHWQAKGDGKPPEKPAANAASGDSAANTPGPTDELTENQAKNKPKPENKPEEQQDEAAK
jgi:hypothetical protein